MSVKEITVVKIKKLIVNVAAGSKQKKKESTFGESIERVATKLECSSYEATAFHLSGLRDMALANNISYPNDSGMSITCDKLLKKVDEAIEKMKEIQELEQQITQLTLTK